MIRDISLDQWHDDIRSRSASLILAPDNFSIIFCSLGPSGGTACMPGSSLGVSLVFQSNSSAACSCDRFVDGSFRASPQDLSLGEDRPTGEQHHTS